MQILRDGTLIVMLIAGLLKDRVDYSYRYARPNSQDLLMIWGNEYLMYNVLNARGRILHPNKIEKYSNSLKMRNFSDLL